MAVISVRLPDEEKQLFEEYCREQDITMSQVIRRLIKQLIKNP